MSRCAIVLKFHDEDFGKSVKDIDVTADKDVKLKHKIFQGQAYKYFDDYKSFNNHDADWRKDTASLGSVCRALKTN